MNFEKNWGIWWINFFVRSIWWKNRFWKVGRLTNTKLKIFNLNRSTLHLKENSDYVFELLQELILNGGKKGITSSKLLSKVLQVLLSNSPIKIQWCAATVRQSSTRYAIIKLRNEGLYNVHLLSHLLFLKSERSKNLNMLGGTVAHTPKEVPNISKQSSSPHWPKGKQTNNFRVVDPCIHEHKTLITSTMVMLCKSVVHHIWQEQFPL